MKNKLFYFTLIVALLFCKSIILGGSKVETFNLKNGIKVVYKQVEGRNLTALKLCSPVSIAYENTDKAGVTSLLYSVMNQSTKKRDVTTLATDIENLGSSIGFDVEYDFSGLNLECMSKYFDKTLEIFTDIITNPAFDEKEIEKQKILHTESIKNRADNITQTAYDKMISEFFSKNNPYSYTSYGKIETLKNITKQDIIDTYNKIFTTKGIVITVVTDIEASQIKSKLNKSFGSLKFTQEAIQPAFTDNLPLKQEKIYSAKFNQAFIIYAYDVPNIYNKDFYTLKLIASVLGSRMTSRLFIELREKLGLAYEVNTRFPTRKNSSYFSIYIGLDKKNIQITKDGIEKIMEDLCNTAVPEQELKDTKQYVKGIYLLSNQSVERQAYNLMFGEIFGLGYKFNDLFIEELEKVTSDDILKVANKYFKQTPLKIILQPEK